MATYRITYKEPSIAAIVNEFLGETRILPRDRLLKAAGRIELRSSEGDVFRLQKGAEFTLKEMEEGLQPEVYGEVYAIVLQSWPKYRTTCPNCRSHGSAPLQLLMRPSSKLENTDEYFLAMGEMVIHEFDENGQYYVICSLRQGQRAFVTFDSKVAAGPARYEAEIADMENSEWDYILENYADHRAWM